MAKIYLDKLKAKYGFKKGTVTSLNYRQLMQDILANQTENISKATARLSKANYDKQAKKITKKEKKLILPDVHEVMPKRALFVKKAVQDGDIITDNLRDSLTRNLRQSLQDFKTKKKGEPAYIRRTGKYAGTINPKVIDDFQKRIIGTYESYTKRDPKTGVPGNVRQIAVTEVRSAVNEMKHTYNQNLLDKNKDKVKMMKEWRQNKQLSKVPRRGHSEVHGKRIGMEELFDVSLYVEVKGRMVKTGSTNMRFPHDPDAPASQKIGCNCDVLYYAVTI